MDFEFTIADKKHRVRTDGRSPKTSITVDDRSYEVDWCRLEGGVISLIIGGRSHSARVARRDGGVVVSIGGHQFSLDAGSAEAETFSASGGATGAGGSIKAPMPGTVVKVLVSEGDRVGINQGLIIVEAMKMENEVRSPVDGTVSKINVAAGDSVGTTEAMIEIAPAGGEE